MSLSQAQAHEALTSLNSWGSWKDHGLHGSHNLQHIFVQPFFTIAQEQLALRRYAAYIYSPTTLSAHEHKLMIVQLMKGS